MHVNTKSLHLCPESLTRVCRGNDLYSYGQILWLTLMGANKTHTGPLVRRKLVVVFKTQFGVSFILIFFPHVWNFTFHIYFCLEKSYQICNQSCTSICHRCKTPQFWTMFAIDKIKYIAFDAKMSFCAVYPVCSEGQEKHTNRREMIIKNKL